VTVECSLSLNFNRNFLVRTVTILSPSGLNRLSRGVTALSFVAPSNESSYIFKKTERTNNKRFAIDCDLTEPLLHCEIINRTGSSQILNLSLILK